MIVLVESSYSGLWKNAKPHEEGIYKWPNGSGITSEIVDNRRDVFGRYSQADGYVYLGN